jgi:hypothetical protein
MSWTIENRTFPLDVEIREGTINADRFTGTVITADGSKVTGMFNWNTDVKSPFNASFSPEERWARLWTEGNVSYRIFNASCSYIKGTLSIHSKFQNVSAYGAVCDSLTAYHRVRNNGYFLDSAVLYYKNIPWRSSGKVIWKDGDQGLTFAVDNPKFGRASYTMPEFEEMKATASGLDLENAFYPGLKKLFPYKPRVTGIFNWDRKKMTGNSDLTASIILMNRPVTVAMESRWDPEKLNISSLQIDHKREKLSGSGLIMLNGRQFYDVSRLGLADVAYVKADIHKLNAAGWVNIYKDSLMKTAEVNGNMTYNGKEGFTGAYHITNARFFKTDTIFEISSLSLNGSGNGIRLDAVTHSDRYAALNNSITFELTNMFQKNPEIRTSVIADENFRILLEGLVYDQHYFKGNLSARGDIQLPYDVGDLQQVDLSGELILPLSRKSDRKLDFKGNLSRALYSIQDMSPLDLSSPISLSSTGMEFPNIRIANEQDQQLNGYGFYSFSALNNMEFHIQGSEMDFKLPEQTRLGLHKIKADIIRSSEGMNFNASFAKGVYQSSQPNFYASGIIHSGKILYHVPVMKQRGIHRNSISTNLILENAYFKYDNIKFKQLLTLFTKRPKKQIKRKGKPVNIQLQIATRGFNNKVDTDILKFTFEGETEISGTYPYLLAKGEVNSLEGEFGIAKQGYNLEELSIRWENEPIEEGQVDMTAVKWLAQSCTAPDPDEQCSIEMHLTGKLEEMEFSYGGTCAGDLGESLEPVVLLTSAAKGCYDTDLSGEDPYAMIEGQVSSGLSRIISKTTRDVIMQTRIRGTGSLLLKDEENEIEAREPVSVEIETREWNRLRLRAKSGYIPGAAVANPWEYEAGVVWRPPLEHLSRDSTWKERVKKRVKVQALGTSGSSEQTVAEQEEEQKELRGQLGINYHYEFWNLW